MVKNVSFIVLTHAPESLYALIMTCLLISILLKGALLCCGQIFFIPWPTFLFCY